MIEIQKSKFVERIEKNITAPDSAGLLLTPLHGFDSLGKSLFPIHILTALLTNHLVSFHTMQGLTNKPPPPWRIPFTTTFINGHSDWAGWMVFYFKDGCLAGEEGACPIDRSQRRSRIEMMGGMGDWGF